MNPKFALWLLIGFFIFMQPFIVGWAAGRKNRDGFLWFFLALIWDGGGGGVLWLFVLPFLIGEDHMTIALILVSWALAPTLVIAMAPRRNADRGGVPRRRHVHHRRRQHA